MGCAGDTALQTRGLSQRYAPKAGQTRGIGATTGNDKRKSRECILPTAGGRDQSY